MEYGNNIICIIIENITAKVMVAYWPFKSSRKYTKTNVNNDVEVDAPEICAAVKSGKLVFVS